LRPDVNPDKEIGDTEQQQFASLAATGATTTAGPFEFVGVTTGIDLHPISLRIMAQSLCFWSTCASWRNSRASRIGLLAIADRVPVPKQARFAFIAENSLSPMKKPVADCESLIRAQRSGLGSAWQSLRL